MPRPKGPSTLATDPGTPVEQLAEYFGNQHLHPSLAENPVLPQKMLVELAQSRKAVVRKRVAANPNVPYDLMLELAREFPDQFLENPVFPLLLLENPLMFAEWPIASLKGLLRSKNPPAELLAWAAHHRDAGVIQALLLNPLVTREMLQVALENHPALRSLITTHRNWDTLVVDLKAVESLVWRAAVEQLPQESRCQVAGDPGMAVGVLRELTEDASSRVRQAVAHNPATPVDLLQGLANDRYVNVRQGVAQNPNAPAEILRQLAHDRDEVVRDAAYMRLRAERARYTSTLPPEAAQRLLEQGWRGGQLEASPQETRVIPQTAAPVAQWASSSNLSLRLCGLLHPDCPAEILVRNLRSKDWRIRFALAIHGETPLEALHQLAHDWDHRVRAAVEAREEKPEFRRSA